MTDNLIGAALAGACSRWASSSLGGGGAGSRACDGRANDRGAEDDPAVGVNRQPSDYLAGRAAT
jgi:hypothetical protein